MLIVVITANKLIANGKLNIDAGLLPVCKESSNMRVVVKSEALLSIIGVRDANNAANSADTNRVVVIRWPKGDVGILAMLVVVIADKTSINNIWSILVVVIATGRLIADRKI